MTIQEILNLAINVDAADIFLVGGMSRGGRYETLAVFNSFSRKEYT